MKLGWGVTEWFLSCLRFLKPDLQMLLNLNQQVFESLGIGFKKIKIKKPQSKPDESNKVEPTL